MKTETTGLWHSKVAPGLLEIYNDEQRRQAYSKHMVKLDFRGSFSKIQGDIEIISIIDHQLQVLLPLNSLPDLASLQETRSIHLA